MLCCWGVSGWLVGVVNCRSTIIHPSIQQSRRAVSSSCYPADLLAVYTPHINTCQAGSTGSCTMQALCARAVRWFFSNFNPETYIVIVVLHSNFFSVVFFWYFLMQTILFLFSRPQAMGRKPAVRPSVQLILQASLF